ncbi:MAG: NAD(P)-dependent oxidoreductase, partial [Nocardioides sp.]|uniref:NAD(P)-dependent oxidoreductase n=1 Tax=Nocardioides sp. TaxID=35761 RepID=UPI003F0CC3A1
MSGEVMVVVPTAELAEAVGPVDGAVIEVWDGDGPPPEGATLWVAPYMTHGGVIRRTAELSELRVVQLQSAGYEGVPEHIPSGVLLCNGSGVHDDATAEHAVGLVLASLRGIPEAVRAAEQGRWVRMPGRRSLADSRVMVLGYGSIGRAVAERLVPMKASVVAVASRARAGDGVVEEVHGVDELGALLPQVDVVVVLTPLSDA